MSSESIAHEAGGRMGYSLRGHEGEHKIKLNTNIRNKENELNAL